MSTNSNSALNHSKGPSPSIREILTPLIAIILGLFMVTLDEGIINVAIPKLSSAFHAPLSALQWSVTGYVLACAAVIPLSGWLSDRFGAKRLLLFSIGFFTLGSLLCAIATDPAQLMIYRIIQGLGGGMVTPVSLAFVYRLSPADKVGSVMGVLGIPVLLAPALGSILAGWLVDYASWQWVFIINIPIGIVATLIGIRYLPGIDRQSVPALDVKGMLLAPIAFAGLSYGVSEGVYGWTSVQAMTGLIIGLAALLLFIFVETRHKQPILELRVFKSWDFTRSILIQWVSQIALFGSMFIIPQFLQQAQNYSAFSTGVIMLPLAVTAGIFMSFSGTLYDKIGARPLVMTGLAFVTLAAFMLTRITASDGVSVLIVPLGLIGAGLGISLMPLNTHMLQVSPQHLTDRVSSLTNAFRQVMNSFAVAGLVTVLSSYMNIFMPEGGKPTLETWTNSFSGLFKVMMYIAIAGCILAVLLKKPKRSSGTMDSKENLEADNMSF